VRRPGQGSGERDAGAFTDGAGAAGSLLVQLPRHPTRGPRCAAPADQPWPAELVDDLVRELLDGTWRGRRLGGAARYGRDVCDAEALAPTREGQPQPEPLDLAAARLVEHHDGAPRHAARLCERLRRERLVMRHRAQNLEGGTARSGAGAAPCSVLGARTSKLELARLGVRNIGSK